jgi:hypothetical protein
MMVKAINNFIVGEWDYKMLHYSSVTCLAHSSLVYSDQSKLAFHTNILEYFAVTVLHCLFIGTNKNSASQ